jgi:hypothetical protein
VTPARTVLLVVLLVACAGLGVGVVALSERAPADRGVPASAASPVTEGPVAVLREWDRRRAAAWAAGDVRRLRSLYVPGSTAANRDAARLQGWLDRGRRVRMETQVLRARVVHERPGALTLAVTDRVARAVTDDGTLLPADAPSTWQVALRRIGGAWVVASVRR